LASLDELLYDIRRIEEHREVLTEKKIKSIYKSLEKDLNAFIGEEYIKYSDKDGRLFLSYLDSKNKRAKFLSEIAKNVDSISPQVRKEILDLVDKTYEKTYSGIAKAVKEADDTKDLLSGTKTLVRPEVLKRAVDNNIEKLTLNAVMEKHRAEIIADIQQTLNVGLMNGDRYETMAKRIQERLGVSYSKASNIARTESHRNIESGFMDGAKETSKTLEGSDLIYAATWRTMKDERVRPQQRRKTKKGWKTTISKNGANHMAMEGKTIKVGEKFQLEPNVFAECPSMSGTARNDCNCRCYLRYKLMTVEEFAKATNQTVDAVRKKYNISSATEEIEVIELEMSNFPDAFTKGAEGKNTQKLIDFVNGIEGADPNALKLYASIGKLENFSANNIPFKISHGKNHAINYRYKPSNHELVDVKFNIPKFKGDNIAGQVNTTLHEQMHLLDMYGRKDVKKYNNWFSSTRQPLIDTFRGTSDEIGDEIADLFKKHNAEHEAIRKRLEATYKKKIADVRESYLPNGMSPWEDITAYRKYEKEAKKLRAAMEVERDYESRNIMGGGVCNLQDIYDALSKGTYRANGTVAYGHGQQYYAREGNRIKETVANYASLSVTRPDLIDMLRKDKPELCAELDNLIIDLIKKAGG
jgi:hypothetical protein